MRKSLLVISLLLLMCSGAVFADHHEANAGVAAVPVGGDGPGIALPGGAYEFAIHAGEGDYLSFASMLAQSNDGFLAPNEYGIALYDMGAPVSGDVTDQVYYWDLGSERNEPIGEGMYQAPRQAEPNSGPAGDGMVRLASDLDDNLSYPTAAELVVVTLTAGDMGEFTVRIDNVSDMSMYPSPITPVFWIVHSGDMMMMDEDMMMDDNMAEEDDDMMDDEMADDDDMMMDGEMMMMKMGILFTSGQSDYGHGLEALAEDGDPSALAAHHGVMMDEMMMDDEMEEDDDDM
ncbi:MAG: spondin domain-containing protein [Anaerolineae bacterium]|nr:spondin domain-containing protein [Anaerolineae bacterium]